MLSLALYFGGAFVTCTMAMVFMELVKVHPKASKSKQAEWELTRGQLLLVSILWPGVALIMMAEVSRGWLKDKL